MFAYLLIVLIMAFGLRMVQASTPRPLRIGVQVMMVLLFVQVGLGIATLMYLVPVALGAAHQGGAVCLFTSSLFVSHWLYRSAS
jgi:cytochrome c oxidase assembly protein subunit 15